MKPTIQTILTATLASLLALLAAAASAENTPNYLIVNNDYSLGNSATFYTITGASLQRKGIISTGGKGNDGIGSVSTKRITVLRNPAQACVFVADANTSDVAAIDISTLKVTGLFKGSSTDNGQASGLGVVNNGKYLFANFTGSETIGAFQVLGGCKLAFLQDVTAQGLNGGSITDMAVSNHNLLVASFSDGSIESFDVSTGVPVPNGDLQLSTAATQGSFPSGVDLSADGRYAIFADGGAPPSAEVSDTSSGKLAPTVVYSNLGEGSADVSLWLSPDEKLLYLGDFNSGQVTAASFDKNTGVLTPGCTSAVLNGFGSLWSFVGGITTGAPSGSGGIVFVAEPDARIGIVHVAENTGGCTLTEVLGSPILERGTITVESLTAYPPRRF